jgi:hypothetical protein
MASTAPWVTLERRSFDGLRHSGAGAVPPPKIGDFALLPNCPCNPGRASPYCPVRGAASSTPIPTRRRGLGQALRRSRLGRRHAVVFAWVASGNTSLTVPVGRDGKRVGSRLASRRRDLQARQIVRPARHMLFPVDAGEAAVDEPEQGPAPLRNQLDLDGG